MRAKILATWIIFFLVGTMIAFALERNVSLWLILAFIFLGSAFALFSKRIFWAIIFAFGCFFLGVALFQNQEQRLLESNTRLAGQRTLKGTVITIPQLTELGVQARVQIGTGEVLLVYLPFYPSVKYADIINIEGNVKKYSAEKQNYLIKERVAGEVSVKSFRTIGKNDSPKIKAKGILFWLRTEMNQEILKALPKEEAGLASGLILGEKALVSTELTRKLQTSGTSHIIALSGYNITIVLSLFVFLKNKASRLINLIVPLMFISFFVVMTGGSASIVRAGIMGFLPLVARYIGRPNNSFMAILVSAFLMVALNPFITLYDVGFQLSFMAMIGLVYIAPLIANLFSKDNYLITVLTQTLAAQLSVLPLIVYNFGVVSVIAPLSNLLILSLVPVGMLLSFLVGLCGMLQPIMGKLASLFAYPVLKLFNLLISFFGNLSFSAFQFKITSPVWIIISYALLFDLIIFFKKKAASKP